MMKNLSNFENFLVESKPLYLGENIFIDVQPDNYFEGVILEAKSLLTRKNLQTRLKNLLKKEKPFTSKF